MSRRQIALPQTSRGARIAIVTGCAALAVLAGLANLALGPVHIPFGGVLAVLRAACGGDAADPLHASVIGDLRGPRVLLGFTVGAALSVSGAAFQGLFRNPLADPSLLGISAGAATGAVAFIVLGDKVAGLTGAARILGLPFAAIVGAAVAALALHTLGRRSGTLATANLLLTGIAINALCSALSGLLIFASDDQQLRELTFWSLGSLARAHWSTVLPLVPVAAVAVFALLALARAIDALALSEADAGHLGYRVERLKTAIIVATATAVGTAVALAGLIAFVGLIVPHILRTLLGAAHRYVFAGSFGLGAALLLSADLVARTAVLPAELPIGILTSLLGGPFFLALMLRRSALTGDRV